VKDLATERLYWQRGIEHLAGVDEAGRGPLAGPVVAAAVIFPKDVFIDGVDDSKKLSEKKRNTLCILIKQQALSIGIDDLSLQPQFAAVDGNSFKHDTLPYENIIDGDAKVFTIAAASIVAKVTRDHMMSEYHELYPVYGFAKHKGYGTKEHREAIRQHGLCDIHRRSFHVKLD